MEQKEGAFSDFPISEETIKLLKACGVTFLFPIQAKTFHHVYSGKDLIAQARTGTGKTFSFAIPLVEKLLGELQDRKRGRAPQVSIFNTVFRVYRFQVRTEKRHCLDFTYISLCFVLSS